MDRRSLARIVLICSLLNVGVLSSSTSFGLAQGRAAPLPLTPAAAPAAADDIVHAAAAWAQPAGVLPQALSGALAARRGLAGQLAESVAPAYRGAQGQGGALATLAMQALSGQEDRTPDPLLRMEDLLAGTLGPAGAIFTPQHSVGADARGLSGLASSLVDLGSGSLHLTYQDLSVPSRGYPLACSARSRRCAGSAAPWAQDGRSPMERGLSFSSGGAPANTGGRRHDHALHALAGAIDLSGDR